MKILVGHTGFVGSNLLINGDFDMGVNSATVKQAYGTCPELLVYAGLKAEKYMANQAPEQDYALILEAQENIRRINPRRLVLISTVDVLPNPCGTDETLLIDADNLQPYGANRYRMEQWVRKQYPDALIIRLPALFGVNIRKNFIYDYMQIIPARLNDNKWRELCDKAPELRTYYSAEKNGFMKVNELTKEERIYLKKLFLSTGFSALNFTDSRSAYQFYPLDRLWADLQTALKQGLLLLHPATEPVTAAEVYHYLSGRAFCNELQGPPAFYDFRTVHDQLYGGKDGYIMSKDEVLCRLKVFIGSCEH